MDEKKTCDRPLEARVNTEQDVVWLCLHCDLMDGT